MIRRHRKEQLVGLGRKVGAITCDGDQTGVGIDTDGDDEAAAPLHTGADVRKDLLAPGPADGRTVTFQPLRECVPRVAPRDVDGSAAVGIAQAHEREIEAQ